MAKKGQTFRKYTEEWKQNAIRMYVQENMGYKTISKVLGMPNHSPIIQWVRKYQNGESLLDQRGKTTKENNPLVGRPRTRFESIEEERDYLKAQVEYLKKCIQNLYEGSDSRR